MNPYSDHQPLGRTGQFLLSILFLLGAAGCGGHYADDRDSTWCVEDPSVLPAAEAAVGEWRERSLELETTPVDLHFVVREHCPRDAQYLVAGPLDADLAGQWGYDESFASQASRIVYDPSEIDSEDYLRRVLLHEFGHYLTGSEHSTSPDDVMQAWLSSDSPPYHLSDADAARLVHGTGWHY